MLFFPLWFFYFIKKCRLIYYHKTNNDNSGTRHWTISVAREQQIVTSRKIAKPEEKRSVPGMCDENHTYLLSKRLHCKFSVLIFPLDISFHSMRSFARTKHTNRAGTLRPLQKKLFLTVNGCGWVGNGTASHFCVGTYYDFRRMIATWPGHERLQRFICHSVCCSRYMRHTTLRIVESIAHMVKSEFVGWMLKPLLLLHALNFFGTKNRYSFHLRNILCNRAALILTVAVPHKSGIETIRYSSHNLTHSEETKSLRIIERKVE